MNILALKGFSISKVLISQSVSIIWADEWEL